MTTELITIKAVQDALGISERTAFRLVKSGELKGFKVGREWRFTQADIEAYIDRQRKKAERILEAPAEEAKAG